MGGVGCPRDTALSWFGDVSQCGEWMKLFVLRGCRPYRPRLGPVDKRAQRSLSLVKERVFVKEVEADASPALPAWSSSGEDSQINGE